MKTLRGEHLARCIGRMAGARRRGAGRAAGPAALAAHCASGTAACVLADSREATCRGLAGGVEGTGRYDHFALIPPRLQLASSGQDAVCHAPPVARARFRLTQLPPTPPHPTCNPLRQARTARPSSRLRTRRGRASCWPTPRSTSWGRSRTSGRRATPSAPSSWAPPRARCTARCGPRACGVVWAGCRAADSRGFAGGDGA